MKVLDFLCFNQNTIYEIFFFISIVIENSPRELSLKKKNNVPTSAVSQYLFSIFLQYHDIVLHFLYLLFVHRFL